jgi:hypothetical protein
MVLISYIDGTMMPEDGKLEEAVARNASNDAYFVCRDGNLICVPDILVVKTIHPGNLELPNLASYLENHQEEVEDVYLDLWHQFGFPDKQ